MGNANNLQHELWVKRHWSWKCLKRVWERGKTLMASIFSYFNAITSLSQVTFRSLDCLWKYQCTRWPNGHPRSLPVFIKLTTMLKWVCSKTYSPFYGLWWYKTPKQRLWFNKYRQLIDWLIAFCLNPFFNSISMVTRRSVNQRMFFWTSFIQYSSKYLLQADGSIPHNHCRKNWHRW